MTEGFSMSELINIKINGKEISCEKGKTILQVAKENGIDIPNMCYSEKVKLYGACGVCVVEAKGVPKLLRACASFVNDGMEIETETERVKQARKVALELMLSDHVGDCRPPCAKACPAGTDCQGYVGLIANGRFEEANRLIKDKIPLPASIGRVCPHPFEKKCRRAAIDDAVQIAYLKRFAADLDIEKVEEALYAGGDAEVYTPEIGAATGKKVAIIGGGPAGLTCAYSLRRKGHGVTVFDAMPKMGGMLRYGIPEYRLPKKIVDIETEAIARMGVEFKNNVKIGKNGISLESIRRDFDAVIIAIGNWTAQKMRIPGEELSGVYGGIDFLRMLIEGKNVNIGDRVAVVGGGNTAMDACRSAVRCGAREVYTFYRRTRAEMPANAEEIEEAEEEGVIFKFLCNPAEIIGEDGRVTAIKGQVMELGEPDASGRRSPVPVEGKFDIVAVDSVIMAIGQKIDNDGFEELELTKRGEFVTDIKTWQTGVPGIFACGDAATGGFAKIAVGAIGGALKTSAAVDSFLTGRIEAFDESRVYPLYSERELTPGQIRENNPDKAPVEKILMSRDEAAERKNAFKEYMHGFTKEEAMEEASKCLECGCQDYYECKLINYANRYNAEPSRLAGVKHKASIKDVNEFIYRDNAKCMLCGLCVRACEEVTGNTALGLVGRGFDTLVTPEMGLPLNNSKCTACGLCVSLCPTGALGERSVLKKSVPLPKETYASKCRFCSLACDVKADNFGRSLLRVTAGDGCKNLCNLGRFGYTNEDNQPVLVKDVKTEVKKLLSKALTNVPSLNTYAPYVVISKLHTKAEALKISEAVKEIFDNAVISCGTRALSDAETAKIAACAEQNGVAEVEFTYGNVEFGGALAFEKMPENTSIIITFGENADNNGDISMLRLPLIFERI